MPQAALTRPVILQVLPSLETGGVERGAIEMVQATSAAGGIPLVASAGGPMVAGVERAGGRHFRLPLLTKDPLNIWLNARPLTRLIHEQGVSLVHARSRAPAWSAWIAARRAGVPFITTWHGVYAETFPGKRLYNGIMARGERVIAISHYVARQIEDRHRVAPDRIRVIHRGVDPSVFDPASVGGERIHRLAQAWRLPAGARVVMLPARLTAWKGAGLLLEAMAKLGAGEPVYCVLVGSDQGRTTFVRHLSAQAAHLGVADRVRFAGQCDDMPAALGLADVVVCPSLRPEPFGRSVIEAQAMGRLVIASNHGGAVETIDPGETGWLIPPNDAASLAQAIDFALSLPAEDRAAMGAAARAHVLAHFTTATMQAATLAVYSELLE